MEHRLFVIVDGQNDENLKVCYTCIYILYKYICLKSISHRFLVLYKNYLTILIDKKLIDIDLKPFEKHA